MNNPGHKEREKIYSDILSLKTIDTDTYIKSVSSCEMVSVLDEVFADSHTVGAYHPSDEKKDTPSSAIKAFMTKAEALEKTCDYPDKLLDLLEKYTSNIPSGKDTPDIPLFDQIKTKAATELCKWDLAHSEEHPKKEFIIIGADVSGIQNYIYRIPSKKAAKNLKGRSFYLQMLSDAVSRVILRDLNLYRGNLIYNSGGGFYILAPNITDVVNRLKSSISFIEKKIREAHGDELFVSIDFVEVSSDELNGKGEKSLRDIWREVFLKSDRKKSCREADSIRENYAYYFNPSPLKTDSAEENRQEVRIGEALRKYGEPYVSEAPPTSIDQDEVSVCPANLGFHYSFIKDAHTHQSYAGENYNDFAEMCKGAEEKGTIKRLGVLRMDVDNLGYIFQKGLSDDKVNLPRMSALSRTVNLFFTKNLQELREKYDSKHLSIIYSGGDDIFVVGDWCATIGFAELIREEFREYTCHNPKISISAGIAVIETKFPIIKGAEFAAEEEDRAKHHECCGKEKNSISFLSTALNYDEEFPMVKALKEQIVAGINSGTLPKSFIGKVLSHYSKAEIVKHRIGNSKTYWMLSYDLGRLRRDRVKDHELQAMIDNCIKETFSANGYLNGKSVKTEYHPLELWAFACRWADLETRQENN